MLNECILLLKIDVMVVEIYLDNKVRSSMWVKFYFVVLYKIDEFGEV